MSEQWIFGTVDFVSIKDDHADVVDFKFGRGEVDDSDINIQGQAYLLGVMDKFPLLQDCYSSLHSSTAR